MVKSSFYDQYWARYYDFNNFYSNYNYIENFEVTFVNLHSNPKIYGPNADLRLKISWYFIGKSSHFNLQLINSFNNIYRYCKDIPLALTIDY